MNIGDIVPDFQLRDQNSKDFKLYSIKDKRILLSFHPLAWTDVCSKQMQSLENNKDKFTSLNTLPVGISVDTVPSKKAWAQSLGITSIPLLSDFWPHGKTAIAYGIFRERGGTSERANIILNQDYKVIFIKIYEISQLPDINEILKFLKG